MPMPNSKKTFPTIEEFKSRLFHVKVTEKELQELQKALDEEKTYQRSKMETKIISNSPKN